MVSIVLTPYEFAADNEFSAKSRATDSLFEVEVKAVKIIILA